MRVCFGAARRFGACAARGGSSKCEARSTILRPFDEAQGRLRSRQEFETRRMAGATNSKSEWSNDQNEEESRITQI